MLKTVIDTRRNDDVRKVLDTAKGNDMPETRIQCLKFDCVSELFDDHHGKEVRGTEEDNKMEALYQVDMRLQSCIDI